MQQQIEQNRQRHAEEVAQLRAREQSLAVRDDAALPAPPDQPSAPGATPNPSAAARTQTTAPLTTAAVQEEMLRAGDEVLYTQGDGSVVPVKVVKVHSVGEGGGITVFLPGPSSTSLPTPAPTSSDAAGEGQSAAAGGAAGAGVGAGGADVGSSAGAGGRERQTVASRLAFSAASAVALLAETRQANEQLKAEMSALRRHGWSECGSP